MRRSGRETAILNHIESLALLRSKLLQNTEEIPEFDLLKISYHAASAARLGEEVIHFRSKGRDMAKRAGIPG